MGWNVLSLSEDHRLPHLSNELSSVRVDMVGLSETRWPGSGETSSKGFTYYWSGMSNGHHVKGVAIGIPPCLSVLNLLYYSPHVISNIICFKKLSWIALKNSSITLLPIIKLQSTFLQLKITYNTYLIVPCCSIYFLAK